MRQSIFACSYFVLSRPGADYFEIGNTFIVIDYDYNYFAKVIEYNSNNFGFMRRQYQ